MNQVQLKQVRAWVKEHREELIADIVALVNIPSVSTPEQSEDAPFGENCKNALNTIEEMGQRYGLVLKNADQNCCQLWWETTAAQTKDTLGIWGHLDVVPADSAWHFPAFDATYKDGFLIGRGVGDNKGPCIGSMYAVRCLKELGYELPYSVALCYGTSEENGMMDIKAWMENHPVPDYNLVADCGFPLCYGEKGRLDISFQVKKEGGLKDLDVFAGSVTNMIPEYAACKFKAADERIEGYGVATHVAFPENSSNAILDLSNKVLQEEQPLDQKQKSLFEFLKLMTEDAYGKTAGIYMEDEVSGSLVGTITWIRSTDSIIEMRADYRYPIFERYQSDEEKRSEGSELIEQLEEIAEKYGVEVKILQNSKPSYFPQNHPFAQSLLKSYRQYSGSKTEPFVMSGGSYARMLPRAVAYGLSSEHKKIYHEIGWPPGMGDYHQANESVFVDELLEGVIIYCKTLMELKFT